MALAAELRRRGITTHVVVIGEAGQLRKQLSREGVPFTALGMRPGSKILRHPRRFAAAVSAGGTTVAVLDAFGYQGAALRMGGFQGHTIGVEHGSLANLHLLPFYRRIVRIADRLIGLRTNDAEVAVSQYMVALARRTFHHRRLVYVPNGIRVPPRLPLPSITSGQLRLGYAGRLARGKGVDVLIRAIALLHAEGAQAAPVLLIAGDGPERSRLEALAHDLALRKIGSLPGLDRRHAKFLVSVPCGGSTFGRVPRVLLPQCRRGDGLRPGCNRHGSRRSAGSRRRR